MDWGGRGDPRTLPVNCPSQPVGSLLMMDGRPDEWLRRHRVTEVGMEEVGDGSRVPSFFSVVTTEDIARTSQRRSGFRVTAAMIVTAKIWSMLHARKA